MFADDTAFAAHYHQQAQEIITRFAKYAKDFGLKINITKTEMMYQPPPGKHDEGKRSVYIEKSSTESRTSNTLAQPSQTTTNLIKNSN